MRWRRWFGSVMLPALAAAAVTLAHELAGPAPAGQPAAARAATPLPVPPAWTPRRTTLHLVPAESVARFMVRGAADLEVACHDVSGTVEIDADGRPVALDFRLDLDEVAGEPGIDSLAPLRRLLGVHVRGSAITWAGRLVADQTFAQAGVRRVDYLGLLGFGGRCHLRPMTLWVSSLLPGTLRLQGIGTVEGRDFGLPQRYEWGLVPSGTQITLALDLAFRP